MNRLPPLSIDETFSRQVEAALDGLVVAVFHWSELMAARSVPEDGDVVVREEKQEPDRVFVLHTAPGPDQFLYHTQEEAVAQAVTFAKRQLVRAWLTDEGYDFLLLEDFRVVESVSTSEVS
jgi:hypothetical protein